MTELVQEGPHCNHIVDNIFIGDVFSLGDTEFISGLSQIVSLVENPFKQFHACAGIIQFEFFFIDPKYQSWHTGRRYFLLITGLLTLVHSATNPARRLSFFI